MTANLPILEKVNGLYLGYLTSISVISDRMAIKSNQPEYILMSANLICSITKYMMTHSSLPISLEIVFATNISKMLKHLNSQTAQSLPSVFQEVSESYIYATNPVEEFNRIYFLKRTHFPMQAPPPLDDDFIYSHCLLIGTLRNTKEMIVTTELVSRMLNVSTCSIACCMALNLFIHYTLFANEPTNYSNVTLTQSQIIDNTIKTAKNFVGDKYKGAFLRYAYMSFEGLHLEQYNVDHSLKVMGVGLWAVRELQRQLENTFGANGQPIEEKYYSILNQILLACGDKADPKYVMNYVGSAGALMGLCIGRHGVPTYILKKYPDYYDNIIKIIK